MQISLCALVVVVGGGLARLILPPPQQSYAGMLGWRAIATSGRG